MFSISKKPTISEIQSLYASRKATPVEVTQFFLNRVKQTDNQIQAFDSVLEDRAIAEATFVEELMEEAIKLNPDSWFAELVKKYPLFGIPYSLKSLVMAEGEVFNASGKILDGFKAPYSSTVYQKLKAGGAILVGINVNDQFGHGASGENSDYKITRNPYDQERVAGGSSSGSAGAVASGQVVFSIGTDTGGSIRQPAAFTNTASIKPTYGLVSRYGVMAMASSMEQPSPICNSVFDTFRVLNTISGQDTKDQTSLESSDLKKNLNKILDNQSLPKKLKIGIPKEFYIQGLHPKILAKLNSLKQALARNGHELVDISLPLTKYAVSVYYITMPVELASNLERIDGIRYASQEEYSQEYYQHRSYFGDEPKRRIMLGTYVSSAGYYDAYYNQAQKVRELARKDIEKALSEVDVLLTPTSPEFPFKIGDKSADPLQMYLSDVFTCGVNPVRIPSANIPLGLLEVETKNGKQKLPTGCQVMSRELAEDVIAKLALEIENLRDKAKF